VQHLALELAERQAMTSRIPSRLRSIRSCCNPVLRWPLHEPRSSWNRNHSSVQVLRNHSLELVRSSLELEPVRSSLVLELVRSSLELQARRS